MATKTAQTLKFKNLVRSQVLSVLREMFSDPELGFELTEKAVKRLRRSIVDKNTGNYKELREVLKKYAST